jgi:DNA-binding CsgD family transcriptional regulator
LPYHIGLANAMSALAGLLELDSPPPSIHPASGRWPITPAPAAGSDGDVMDWPLVVGARRMFEGDRQAAIANLREALAHQRVGEGLFRSEAVNLLIIALASTGQPDEAEMLLAEEPPDSVAVFPGLFLSAHAAVAAARGRPDAVDLCLEAAYQARDVGGVISAVAYLAEAARLGAPGRAAAILDEIGYEFEPPTTNARALGIRARATGDGKALLEAAERHAEVRFNDNGLELAQLAAAALGRDTSGAARRATALAQQLRARLQLSSPSFEPLVGLTRRELEVARLAARGATDRDIAENLVVSVRTVESHLAAAYRKLGITSRRQLRDVLAEMG